MNEALLLDEAYRKAEEQILQSALNSDLLEQTKKNAGITQDKTLKRYMGTNKEMERNAMEQAFGNMTIIHNNEKAK